MSRTTKPNSRRGDGDWTMVKALHQVLLSFLQRMPRPRIRRPPMCGMRMISSSALSEKADAYGVKEWLEVPARGTGDWNDLQYAGDEFKDPSASLATTSAAGIAHALCGPLESRGITKRTTTQQLGPLSPPDKRRAFCQNLWRPNRMAGKTPTQPH